MSLDDEPSDFVQDNYTKAVDVLNTCFQQLKELPWNREYTTFERYKNISFKDTGLSKDTELSNWYAHDQDGEGFLNDVDEFFEYTKKSIFEPNSKNDLSDKILLRARLPRNQEKYDPVIKACNDTWRVFVDDLRMFHKHFDLHSQETVFKCYLIPNAPLNIFHNGILMDKKYGIETQSMKDIRDFVLSQNNLLHMHQSLAAWTDTDLRRLGYDDKERFKQHVQTIGNFTTTFLESLKVGMQKDQNKTLWLHQQVLYDVLLYTNAIRALMDMKFSLHGRLKQFKLPENEEQIRPAIDEALEWVKGKFKLGEDSVLKLAKYPDDLIVTNTGELRSYSSWTPKHEKNMLEVFATAFGYKAKHEKNKISAERLLSWAEKAATTREKIMQTMQQVGGAIMEETKQQAKDMFDDGRNIVRTTIQIADQRSWNFKDIFINLIKLIYYILSFFGVSPPLTLVYLLAINFMKAFMSLAIISPDMTQTHAYTIVFQIIFSVLGYTSLVLYFSVTGGFLAYRYALPDIGTVSRDNDNDAGQKSKRNCNRRFIKILKTILFAGLVPSGIYYTFSTVIDRNMNPAYRASNMLSNLADSVAYYDMNSLTYTRDGLYAHMVDIDEKITENELQRESTIRSEIENLHVNMSYISKESFSRFKNLDLRLVIHDGAELLNGDGLVKIEEWIEGSVIFLNGIADYNAQSREGLLLPNNLTHGRGVQESMNSDSWVFLTFEENQSSGTLTKTEAQSIDWELSKNMLRMQTADGRIISAFIIEGETNEENQIRTLSRWRLNTGYLDLQLGRGKNQRTISGERFPTVGFVLRDSDHTIPDLDRQTVSNAVDTFENRVVQRVPSNALREWRSVQQFIAVARATIADALYNAAALWKGKPLSHLFRTHSQIVEISLRVTLDAMKKSALYMQALLLKILGSLPKSMSNMLSAGKNFVNGIQALYQDHGVTGAASEAFKTLKNKMMGQFGKLKEFGKALLAQLAVPVPELGTHHSVGWAEEMRADAEMLISKCDSLTGRLEAADYTDSAWVEQFSRDIEEMIKQSRFDLYRDYSDPEAIHEELRQPPRIQATGVANTRMNKFWLTVAPLDAAQSQAFNNYFPVSYTDPMKEAKSDADLATVAYRKTAFYKDLQMKRTDMLTSTFLEDSQLNIYPMLPYKKMPDTLAKPTERIMFGRLHAFFRDVSTNITEIFTTLHERDKQAMQNAMTVFENHCVENVYDAYSTYAEILYNYTQHTSTQETEPLPAIHKFMYPFVKYYPVEFMMRAVNKMIPGNPDLVRQLEGITRVRQAGVSTLPKTHQDIYKQFCLDCPSNSLNHGNEDEYDDVDDEGDNHGSSTTSNEEALQSVLQKFKSTNSTDAQWVFDHQREFFERKYFYYPKKQVYRTQDAESRFVYYAFYKAFESAIYEPRLRVPTSLQSSGEAWMLRVWEDEERSYTQSQARFDRDIEFFNSDHIPGPTFSPEELVAALENIDLTDLLWAMLDHRGAEGDLDRSSIDTHRYEVLFAFHAAAARATATNDSVTLSFEWPEAIGVPSAGWVTASVRKIVSAIVWGTVEEAREPLAQILSVQRESLEMAVENCESGTTRLAENTAAIENLNSHIEYARRIIRRANTTVQQEPSRNDESYTACIELARECGYRPEADILLNYLFLEEKKRSCDIVLENAPLTLPIVRRLHAIKAGLEAGTPYVPEFMTVDIQSRTAVHIHLTRTEIEGIQTYMKNNASVIDEEAMKSLQRIYTNILTDDAERPKMYERFYRLFDPSRAIEKRVEVAPSKELQEAMELSSELVSFADGQRWQDVRYWLQNVVKDNVVKTTLDVSLFNIAPGNSDLRFEITNPNDIASIRLHSDGHHMTEGRMHTIATLLQLYIQLNERFPSNDFFSRRQIHIDGELPENVLSNLSNSGEDRPRQLMQSLLTNLFFEGRAVDTANIALDFATYILVDAMNLFQPLYERAYDFSNDYETFYTTHVTEYLKDPLQFPNDPLTSYLIGLTHFMDENVSVTELFYKDLRRAGSRITQAITTRGYAARTRQERHEEQNQTPTRQEPSAETIPPEQPSAETVSSEEAPAPSRTFVSSDALMIQSESALTNIERIADNTPGAEEQVQEQLKIVLVPFVQSMQSALAHTADPMQRTLILDETERVLNSAAQKFKRTKSPRRLRIPHVEIYLQRLQGHFRDDTESRAKIDDLKKLWMEGHLRQLEEHTSDASVSLRESILEQARPALTKLRAEAQSADSRAIQNIIQSYMNSIKKAVEDKFQDVARRAIDAYDLKDDEIYIYSFVYDFLKEALKDLRAQINLIREQLTSIKNGSFRASIQFNMEHIKRLLTDFKIELMKKANMNDQEFSQAIEGIASEPLDFEETQLDISNILHARASRQSSALNAMRNRIIGSGQAIIHAFESLDDSGMLADPQTDFPRRTAIDPIDTRTTNGLAGNASVLADTQGTIAAEIPQPRQYDNKSLTTDARNQTRNTNATDLARRVKAAKTDQEKDQVLTDIRQDVQKNVDDDATGSSILWHFYDPKVTIGSLMGVIAALVIARRCRMREDRVLNSLTPEERQGVFDDARRISNLRLEMERIRGRSYKRLKFNVRNGDNRPEEYIIQLNDPTYTLLSTVDQIESLDRVRSLLKEAAANNPTLSTRINLVLRRVDDAEEQVNRAPANVSDAE